MKETDVITEITLEMTSKQLQNREKNQFCVELVV